MSLSARYPAGVCTRVTTTLPAVLGVFLLGSFQADSAYGIDAPILWVVNCTDTGTSGWTHTAKGEISNDGGKNFTVLETRVPQETFM